MGSQLLFVDVDNLEEVEAAINDNTKFVWLKPWGIPWLTFLTWKIWLRLLINTRFLSFRTILSPHHIWLTSSHGVDIAIHSATKFIMIMVRLLEEIVDSGCLTGSFRKFPLCWRFQATIILSLYSYGCSSLYYRCSCSIAPWYRCCLAAICLSC